MTQPVAYT